MVARPEWNGFFSAPSGGEKRQTRRVTRLLPPAPGGKGRRRPGNLAAAAAATVLPATRAGLFVSLRPCLGEWTDDGGAKLFLFFYHSFFFLLSPSERRLGEQRRHWRRAPGPAVRVWTFLFLRSCRPVVPPSSSGGGSRPACSAAAPEIRGRSSWRFGSQPGVWLPPICRLRCACRFLNVKCGYCRE